MSKRNEYITLINEFKTVSPTISDEQRKGLLRRAVQQFDISIDDAADILNSSGLVIGEQEDYFGILGLTVEAIQSLDEVAITERVETAHKNLYSTSLQAGGRPRADGKSEEQWRTLLNQARDVLIDPQKRNAHLTTVQHTEEALVDTPTVPLHLDDDMELILAGEFEMGGSDNEAFNDEQPVHTVFVDAFYIDKYPVTNAQFKAFVDANPQWNKPQGLSKFLPAKYHDGYLLHHWHRNNYLDGQANHPVVHVSWYAAMAYAEWIGKRLPTEAEWEKAARGGLAGKKFPWGDLIDTTKANFGKNIGSTTPVGEYPANEFDLYDMSGNVWEWCLDEWDEHFYASSPSENPVTGDSISRIVNSYRNSKALRLLRGGSWYNKVQNIRTAKRSAALPTYANSNIGFRCVKSITT